MSWSFFKIPSVISGNSGKLLPPSVTRAAEYPMTLRDRLNAAKALKSAAKTPAFAASAMGKAVGMSARSTFAVAKKLKFW